MRFLNRGSGDVAQLGERWLCKPEVAGSIPVVSIKFVFDEFNALSKSRFIGMRRRALVNSWVNPRGYQVKLFDKLICGCSKFYIVFLTKRGESMYQKVERNVWIFILAITHG